MRGRNWRGRDCGGHNNQIYPGRKPHDVLFFFVLFLFVVVCYWN